MNLLALEKFIQLVFQLFDKHDALERMSILDLSQILSAAKHQEIQSNKNEESKRFWDRTADFCLQILKRDLSRINKKTFIVILNSLSQEIQKREPSLGKKLWNLMDMLLLNTL